MNINRLALVYFSATNTTQSLVRAIGENIDSETTEEYNLTQAQLVRNVQLTKNDLLIIGVPSYAGRVPSLILDSLSHIKGDNTPAILLCSYGNRNYDDTLLELRDIVVCNKFKVISAGAFIAQHSIFPKLATGRPNAEDLEQARKFGKDSIGKLQNIDEVNNLSEIQVKGSYPYRENSHSLGLRPRADKRCDECGTCVHECPVQAIRIEQPRISNKELCISCGRCITVCPQHSRAFRGAIYTMASRKFVQSFSARKENEIIFVD